MKNIIELNQNEISSVSGGLFKEIGSAAGMLIGIGVGLYIAVDILKIELSHNFKTKYKIKVKTKYFLAITSSIIICSVTGAAIGHAIDKNIGIAP